MKIISHSGLLRIFPSLRRWQWVKDTGHRSVEVGSQKWAWECWDSPDRAGRSATSLQRLPERSEWIREETPHEESELCVCVWGGGNWAPVS